MSLFAACFLVTTMLYYNSVCGMSMLSLTAIRQNYSHTISNGGTYDKSFKPAVLYSGVFLVGTINVGTPAAPFNLLFSFCSFNTWLLAQYAAAPSFVGYKRKYYVPEQSSSSSNESSIFVDDYFAMGNNYSDILSDPAFGTVRQTFGLADFLQMYARDFWFSYIPADGLLGLAIGDMSFLNGLRPNLRQPVISLWTESWRPNSSESKAVITFGGVDNLHCDPSSWFFVSHTPQPDFDNWWTFVIDSVSIMSKHWRNTEKVTFIAKNVSAVIEYDLLNGVMIPEDEADLLADAFGATKVEHDFYTIACEKRASLPDIMLQMGRRSVVLTPLDYVVETDPENTACALLFIPNRPERRWYIGAGFLNSICMAVDFGRMRVGFAKSRSISPYR